MSLRSSLLAVALTALTAGAVIAQTAQPTPPGQLPARPGQPPPPGQQPPPRTTQPAAPPAATAPRTTQPAQPAAPPAATAPRTTQPAAPPAATAPRPAQPAAAPAPPAAGTIVNINTATLTELDGLPQIGPARAKAILDERTKNGRFKSWEDFIARNVVPKNAEDAIKARVRF